MSGNPLNGRKRGEHVISCMASLVPNIHEDIVDLWDAVTPKLLTYLNGQCLIIKINTNYWYYKSYFNEEVLFCIMHVCTNNYVMCFLKNCIVYEVIF